MLKILELGSNFGFMRANVGYVQEICSGSSKSFVVVVHLQGLEPWAH